MITKRTIASETTRQYFSIIQSNMLEDYEFQQQQSYAMRQDAQHQQQQRYGLNIVPSFACADSRFLKHQNGGFGRSQAHHHHKHQNGWSSASANNYHHHVSGGGGSGAGGGKRMPHSTAGFNGSSQKYSEASMLNNIGMGHEFEFYGEFHTHGTTTAPASVRMQGIRYEEHSSWGDHNNNGFSYDSCNDHFDDGIFCKRNNGGFQRSSPATWIPKGI